MAPALTSHIVRRIEKIPKIQLEWLSSQVDKHIPKDSDTKERVDARRAQLKANINRCIESYSATDEGYIVDYRQKSYGMPDPAGRLWASCGMQAMCKSFRGVIAALMELTDWDMINCHPDLLSQLCKRHNIPCPLLTDYVLHRNKWLNLVKKAANVDRAKAKDLFIRLMYLGSSSTWYKEVKCEKRIEKVENLRKELRRIANAVVGLHPIIHSAVLSNPPEDDSSKDPKARTLSIVLTNLENACLHAAMEYLESLGLQAAVLVFDGFMVHDPDELIDDETMSEWVLKATGYHVRWETKELDSTIAPQEPIDDKLVAESVIGSLEGRILTCHEMCFAYNARTGLWRRRKDVLVVQEAITEWGVDELCFSGFDPLT